MIGYSVPGVSTAKTAYEPYALEMIAGILDAGEGARFAKNLIRKKHVATGANAYYNLYSRYQTQFIVYGAPTQNKNIRELQKELIFELNDLKKTPVSDKELKRIKNQIIAQKTYEKDSIFGQAMELGLLETVGLGWKTSTHYTDAISAVTAAQIQQTAQHYFQEDNMTIAELEPATHSEVNQ